MKNTLQITSIIASFVLALSACKKEGCTDPIATNYNTEAEKDDGSCIYENTLQRITYGADERQHVDLYLPPGHDENTKTVVLIHGGAWTLGPTPDEPLSIFSDGLLDLINPLLDEGYGVAVMKYRLACYTENAAELNGDPNFYFDQMNSDIETVLNVLSLDATDLGISPHHFALLGESAGAHLALMFGLKTNTPILKTVVSLYAPTLLDEESFKLNSASPPYTSLGVNNLFSLSDQALDCDQRTSGTMQVNWGLNSFVGTELAPGSTDPEFTNALSPAFPDNIIEEIPVFLIHGEDDGLVPSGHADSLLAELTETFGTTPAPLTDFTGIHKMKKYPNCGHGLTGNSCNQTIIRQDIIAWLSVHL